MECQGCSNVQNWHLKLSLTLWYKSGEFFRSRVRVLVSGYEMSLWCVFEPASHTTDAVHACNESSALLLAHRQSRKRITWCRRLWRRAWLLWMTSAERQPNSRVHSCAQIWIRSWAPELFWSASSEVLPHDEQTSYTWQFNFSDVHSHMYIYTHTGTVPMLGQYLLVFKFLPVHRGNFWNQLLYLVYFCTKCTEMVTN